MGVACVLAFAPIKERAPLDEILGTLPTAMPVVSLEVGGPVAVAAFSADGRWLLTCASDQTFRVTDPRTLAVKATGRLGLPEGPRLAASVLGGSTATFAVGSTSHRVLVELDETADVRLSAVGPAGRFPPGNLAHRIGWHEVSAATARAHGASGYFRSSRPEWDFVGLEKTSFSGHAAATSSRLGAAEVKAVRLDAYPNPITGAFHPAWSAVAVGYADGRVGVYAVSVTANGVEGDSRVLKYLVPKAAGPVGVVQYSADGSRLLTTATVKETCRVRLWNTTTWECVAGLTLPAGSHEDIERLSPDGVNLLTRGGDASVRLWRVATLPPPEDNQMTAVP